MYKRSFTTSKRYYINNRIRVPEVRVITKEGESLGVMKTGEAIRKAMEQELDLVLISENAVPPVAKILDFNKFLYEERKKTSATKAKSKKSELKELRFGPSIGAGDLTNRVERTKEFLSTGNQVKITVKLRGREVEHPEIAFEKLKVIENELKGYAKTEEAVKRIGNNITITFRKL